MSQEILNKSNYYLVFDYYDYPYAIEFNKDQFRLWCEYDGELTGKYEEENTNFINLTEIKEILPTLTKLEAYATKGKLTYFRHDLPEETVDLQQEFIDFYGSNLNDNYSPDPYISDDELNNRSIYQEYNKPLLNGADNELRYSLGKLYMYFCYYFEEEEACIYFDEDLDYELEQTNISFDTHCLLIDLFKSVIDFGGSEYVYNDGAYNQRSGYDLEGFRLWFYARGSELVYELAANSFEQTNLTTQYFEYLNPTSGIEKVKKDLDKIKLPRLIIESKRKLIPWLREFKPLGINNLKKLNRYLGLK